MLLTILFTLLSAAPSETPGFPATMRGTNTATALGLADLDNDKTLELVVMTEPGMTVIDGKGRQRSGFPVALREARDSGRVTFEHPAAACDLDGDGMPELVAAGSNERLYAITRFGQPVRGFPVALGGVPKGPVSCIGTRGTQKREITLTTLAGSLLVVGGGGGSPRTIASIGKGAEAGVGVADLDGDGAAELITVGGDSKLYVVSTAGKAMKGFPVQLQFRSSGTPSIGDIDSDGRADIVVGAQDFNVHALSIDGKELAGFPIATRYRIYGGVALADIDRDGTIDVVAASGDGGVYAVRGNGTSLPGFPYQTEGRIVVGPVAGDLDRDGYAEIVVVTQVGQLLVLGRDGKALAGFPRSVASRGEVAAALIDVDGDGVPEIAAGGRDGQLHMYTVPSRGDVRGVIAEWPMASHDPEHTARYGPQSARFMNLGFTTEVAHSGDGLKIKYDYIDLDGDAEADTQIRWHVDGKPLPDLDNQRQVPPGRLKKGQHWSFTLQDGASFKAVGDKGPAARIFVSPELLVKNSPPSAPKVEILPTKPNTDQPLEGRVVTPSVDADGDAIAYKYLWIREGAPQSVSPETTTIEPHLTSKNEEWRLVVVPFDDEVEGAPASAVVTIVNLPPGAPELTIAPEVPRIDEAVKVSISKKAVDEDGEPVRYTYRYWVNDVPLDVADSVTGLPARSLHKRDTLKIEVTAHDTDGPGGKATAVVKLKNSAPDAPAVVVSPQHPTTDDVLTFGITSVAEEPDRDPLIFKHQWTVDGQKVDAPVVVPRERTKKGQRWHVSVSAFDGEMQGADADADVLIENTPPTAPLLALDRYVFAEGEPVTPRFIVPAQDADGDQLTLKYRWQKNAQRAGLPETKTALDKGDTHAGESWLLSVIANDGEIDGPAGVVSFEVGSPLPSGAKLTVSPAMPTTRDPVTVTTTVKRAGELRFRWYRNGSLVTAWPLTKGQLKPGEGKKGEIWRVDATAFEGEREVAISSVTFRIANHPPEPPTISLGPPKATGERDLACDINTKSDDPDGDAVRYRVSWSMNGKAVPLAPEQMTVPASLTAKGQSWVCEVTAFDDQGAAKPVKSAALVVADTQPTTPKISIAPAKPDTDAELVCQLEQPSADDDFDTLKYRYGWKVNGKVWTPATNARPSVVPASATRRGDTWECEVVVSDGELVGATSTAKTVIENAAPAPPTVVVLPEKPVAGNDLTCSVVTPGKDPDDDKVQYRFAWVRDGVDQGFAPGSLVVPGRLVKARDIWHCVASSFDGVVEGKGVQAPEVVIGENDAPTTPMLDDIGRRRRRR